MAASWPARSRPPLLAALVLSRGWAAIARHGDRRRRSRSLWAFGAGFAAGPNGPAFGIGAALALAALTALLRARDRAARCVRRRSRRSRRSSSSSPRCCSLFIFYPGRQARCSRRCSMRRAGSRPALAVRAPVHRRHLGRSTACGGGTRCGVAINSALLATHRRRAVDAARPRARAGRAARRPALRGPAQGDVDPADHHAAVRDRAGAGRAVRTHGARHGLARRGVRHSALALDLRPARRDARAAAVVLADRVHDPARRARRGQPGARGGGADAARVARPRVPHGDLAAAAPGARQRVPARLRREPRRLRQSDRARRQLRGAVDEDLLRGRRRAARPRTRRGARDRCCSASRSSRSGCSSAGSAGCRT